MTRPIAAVAAVVLFASLAPAAVQTKVVEYEHAGTKLKGFLAYDDAVTGNQPDVLVEHEWWGLNDHAKSRTKQKNPAAGPPSDARDFNDSSPRSRSTASDLSGVGVEPMRFVA